jgi:hypothetical protein
MSISTGVPIIFINSYTNMPARPFDPVELMKRVMGGGPPVDGRKQREISAYEAFMGFVHAINWRERNMIAMYVFFALYILLIIASRKNVTARHALFLTTCGAIYAAQYINAFFADRWREWGWSQFYFDKNGIFVSSVYSAPLCIIVFGQLVSFDGLAS